MRNERFYMVLWFFAGITKLSISNIESVFSNALWEYDNHVHICHLLYESQTKNHSLCNYVASTCISKREINFVGENYPSRETTYDLIRGDRRLYSRFDCLMIAHFLAHSNCQWNHLLLNLDDVQLFHKVFNGLNPCHTTVQLVTIEVHRYTLSHFCEGTISLLNEIPQFDNIKLKIVLTDHTNLQTIEKNFKNTLLKTNVIESIYVEILGKKKQAITKIIYDILIEVTTHTTSPITNLDLQTLTIENFEYLFSLLIKWSSNLKLVTLSASKTTTPYCREEKRCREFCNLVSTFLSKNRSLKQINLSLPFIDSHLLSCIDTIQSGLDQNSTLEDLTITSQGVVFQRNKHTSKLELVKGKIHLQPSKAAINVEQDDASQPNAVPQSVVPQLGHNSIQYRMSSGDSESPCVEDDLDSFQVSPAKRPKVGNSSKESPCQTTKVHVQPQLNPQQSQPPMATFSSSHLPTLTRSPLCPQLCFSQHATASPQSQPSYCMAGSSSTHETYHSLSKNYKILPQEPNDHQYQSWNNILRPYVPHGLGSTNTLPPMRRTPPTMIQSQPYPWPMPYQQQRHDFFPQYHANPSFNYQPYYYPHFHTHTGMNPPPSMVPAISPYPFAPAQTFMMPPRFPPTAGHHFTSEPEQYRPATAPPVQTIYNPNTGGTPSTISVGHSPSPPPITSTATR